MSVLRLIWATACKAVAVAGDELVARMEQLTRDLNEFNERGKR